LLVERVHLENVARQRSGTSAQLAGITELTIDSVGALTVDDYGFADSAGGGSAALSH
jgi:hypothetical protein